MSTGGSASRIPPYLKGHLLKLGSAEIKPVTDLVEEVRRKLEEAKKMYGILRVGGFGYSSKRILLGRKRKNRSKLVAAISRNVVAESAWIPLTL